MASAGSGRPLPFLVPLSMSVYAPGGAPSRPGCRRGKSKGILALVVEVLS